MNKMKTIFLGFAVLLFAGVVSALSTLTLGKENGLAEECEVRSYDAEKNVVNLRVGEKVINRSLGSFPVSAQNVIRAWATDENFLSLSRFKMDVRKESPFSKSCSAEYIVSVQNQSSTPLNDLAVNCRSFYISSNKKQECYRDVIYIDLLPGEKRVFRLKSRSYFFYLKKEGIHVQVIKLGRLGNLLEREFENGDVPDKAMWSQYEPSTSVAHDRIGQPEWMNMRVVDPAQLIFVEGGTFQMGNLSEEEEFRDSDPAHSVTLDSFQISSYEITQEALARVMNWAIVNSKAVVAGHDEVKTRRGKGSSFFKAKQLGWGKKEEQFIPENPGLAIQTISWFGAVAYCNYRSEMEQLTPCYNKGGLGEWICDFSANGYRLPTEAEWEYAARGGVFGTNDRYSGGNYLDNVGWFEGNGWTEKTITTQKWVDETGRELPRDDITGSYSDVTETIRSHYLTYPGNKKPNELGLYDMSGNAAEWCNDWYGEYKDAQQTNPQGGPRPHLGEKPWRVLRGGCYKDAADLCRVDARAKANPESFFAGFRVVRSVLPRETAASEK